MDTVDDRVTIEQMQSMGKNRPVGEGQVLLVDRGPHPAAGTGSGDQNDDAHEAPETGKRAEIEVAALTE
jgi:hypothetical protein